MPSVLVARQVNEFRRKLHPEQRRAVKRALNELAAGRGDVAELEDEFSGFHRLRVGEHRIVFRYETNGDIRCIFAERRKLIYDMLRANPEWLLED